MADRRGPHTIVYDLKSDRYKCVACGKIVSRKVSDDICVRKAPEMAEAQRTPLERDRLGFRRG